MVICFLFLHSNFYYFNYFIIIIIKHLNISSKLTLIDKEFFFQHVSNIGYILNLFYMILCTNIKKKTLQ